MPPRNGFSLTSRRTPSGRLTATLAMAGLLTCGSLALARPSQPRRAASGVGGGASPPTVAGAVADLAGTGRTVFPFSPRRQSSAGNHRFSL